MSNKTIKQPTLIDGMDNPQKTVNEQPQPSVMDKTFTVERQVVHTEKVEVKFNELSYEDIRYMSRTNLMHIINILLFGGKESPVDVPVDTEVGSIDTDDADDIESKGEQSGQIGRKAGKSSKYHYVFLNKALGKWRWEMGVGSGTHRYEIDAALAVDAYLDKTGDSKRPRNRDEHPEVMHALTNRVRVG